MMLSPIKAGSILTFDYVNHEKRSEPRSVTFQALQYGSNDYYPEPQWLAMCFCHDRKAIRSFALNNITNLKVDYYNV